VLLVAVRPWRNLCPSHFNWIVENVIAVFSLLLEALLKICLHVVITLTFVFGAALATLPRIASRKLELCCNVFTFVFVGAIQSVTLFLW